jgi:hypothetical protein
MFRGTVQAGSLICSVARYTLFRLTVRDSVFGLRLAKSKTGQLLVKDDVVLALWRAIVCDGLRSEFHAPTPLWEAAGKIWEDGPVAYPCAY